MSSFDPNIHVPGNWRCAKCGFVLVANTLHMGSGAITARNEAGEVCPNDGSPMWRVTWKEDALKLSERLEEIAIERNQLRDEVARLRADKRDLMRHLAAFTGDA